MNKRSEPSIFEVLSTKMVTPNMRRVTIGGQGLATFPHGQDGGYVKLMLPGQSTANKPLVRTYTIRRQSADALDIDFALHGDEGSGGPAVSWAQEANPGEEIRVGGPGPAKPLSPDADWYFVLGDMTALPAIAVNLATLPDDAIGDVLIEVQTQDDKQDLQRPEGVALHWLINPEPGLKPELFEQAARAIPWRQGRVYAWSATEFEVMRRMRSYLRGERGLGADQLYISSYWKQGLVEDQHRVVKRADAEQSRA
ncbi:siderophore-interacting protein [uncultured Nitratireductor sp.]|uniref:siderophore-interacting protein n=1 Tax=uncultured Nitratireductor sp. TaxID=520953 RepID=UPI0025EA808E|nr:siderophore-interacting protein [uncultured Nitratireductor sp.]